MTRGPMVLLVCLAIGGVAPAASAGSPDSGACAAAEAVFGNPLVYADAGRPRFNPGPAAPFRGDWKDPANLRQGGWSGASPSPETLRLWAGGTGRNALSCRGVAEIASSRGEVLSEAAVADALKTIGAAGQAGPILTISLPVLNRAGSEGLVQVTRRTSLLGGSIHLILVRKERGVWRAVGQRMLVVS